MRSKPEIPLIRIAALAAIVVSGACTTPPAAPPSPLRFTQPLVLLGEVHDNATQHALRLDAFRAWLETKGVENIKNVNEAVKPASPWFSVYGAKSADELG